MTWKLLVALTWYMLKGSQKMSEIVQFCLSRTHKLAWFWLSSESESNSSLTAGSLMAVQSSPRNSACTESSLSTFHVCHFCCHLLFLFFYFGSACQLLQSAVSARFTSLAMPWAELWTVAFAFPADQCWCFTLAMQESHKAAGSCGRPDDMPEWVQVVLCNRGLNSYAVVRLVIPSISCILATVCGIALDFYNIKHCGDAADRLIDGNLGVEGWIFFFRKTPG